MADAPPESVRKALALLETDSDLARWWESEQRFDASVARSVGESDAPTGLKKEILSVAPDPPSKRRKIIGFPPFLPIAASFMALLFVGILLLDPISAEAEAELGDYMGHVSTYEMDPQDTIQTSDPAVALSELRKRIGSAPDQLPSRLHDLRPTSVHSSKWRGAAVGVIEMKDSEGNALCLFLVESARFPDRDEHPIAPEVRRIRNKALLVWSEQGFLYALSGPDAGEFVNQ